VTSLDFALPKTPDYVEQQASLGWLKLVLAEMAFLETLRNGRAVFAAPFPPGQERQEHDDPARAGAH
jgi:hypothetical protein